MSGFPDIRARIGTARLFLQTLVGSEAHEAASRAQQLALTSALGKCILTAEQKGALSQLALDAPWHGSDARLVAEAIVAERTP
eukprot:4903372-Pyramimonas_sp.AAC.1